ncbi:MAG TPA: alpha/beta fold hydrolase, partial [Candidatus Eremiobacteraceae bacterium]|nr:alpha/beta fold hydrolase [Candidatus Eremiobacteraceae bacterium]
MSYNWQLHSSGTGAAVLLLHAFPFDSRMWDAQAAVLAASHRVIAPDMPGFRGAGAWEGSVSLDAWASSLLERLASDGIRNATVAGCSLGGYLAFALHRKSPHFIRRLALVDSRAVPDTPERKAARLADIERIALDGPAFFRDAARKALADELAAYPSALAAAYAMLDAATSEGIIAALSAMAERPDARPQLTAIRVPTAVIRGSRDQIVSAGEARALASAIGGATY